MSTAIRRLIGRGNLKIRKEGVISHEMIEILLKKIISNI